MNIKSLVSVVISVALLCGATFTAQAGSCGLDEKVPGRLMVRLHPGSDLAAFVAAFQSDHPGFTAALLDSIAGRNIHLLDLAPVPSPAQADAMELDLEVLYGASLQWGEFVYTNDAPEGATGSLFVDGILDGAMFTDQYAADLLGVAAAHTIASGLGTVVALLDTGLDANHPQLAGAVAPGGFNFLGGGTDTSDSGDGMDTDGDGLIDEMTGHGTYVAGLIHLVAPQAKILPLRVLDGDGIGDMWTMAQALFYAIDRRVEVINVSISSTYKSNAIEDAADEAESLGIVLVGAAGNCNREEPGEYPGMLGNEVLGVSATDDLDVKGPFSNYSADLALSAPGVTAMRNGAPDPDRAIISTMPDGQFAYWQGTSMAAPLVSGAAALIRSQQPGLPLSISTYNLVRGRLTSTAVDIAAANPAYPGQLGAGRLNVAAAIALGPPTPPLGDLNGDGMVNVVDLTAVILGWGSCSGPPDPCVSDLDNDGSVGVADLMLVILNWTA